MTFGNIVSTLIMAGIILGLAYLALTSGVHPR